MKKFYILFALLMIIPLISAGAILNFPYDLKVSCEGFTCSDVNITILSPNSTTLINNLPMTSNTYYANYTYIPLVNGKHTYFYSDGGNISEGNFIVTSTGNELTTPQILLYILMFFGLTLFLGFSLWGGITIPFKNQKTPEGEVLRVNWKKYSKIFCLAMSYFFIVALDWVIFNLLYAFSDWVGVSKVFHYLFNLLLAFALPVLIYFILWTLINYINDKKITKFVKRTGLPYG